MGIRRECFPALCQHICDGWGRCSALQTEAAQGKENHKSPSSVPAQPLCVTDRRRSCSLDQLWLFTTLALKLMPFCFHYT